MVCSSTLRAMAVIHSANRGKPRRVKEVAKARSKACRVVQVSVASVMVRLLCRDPWACQHPAGSGQETPLSIQHFGSVVSALRLGNDGFERPPRWALIPLGLRRDLRYLENRCRWSG